MTNDPKFQIGDWVEHGGLVGFVNDVKEEKIQFFGFRTKDDDYKKYTVRAYVNAASAKALPMERFDDVDNFLLGLALDTRDEEWFRELTKKE